MPMYVGASGAHKEVLSMHVGVSGAWKPVLEVWVGAGGVWKPAFTSSFRSVMVPGSSGTYAGYVDGGYGTLTPATMPSSPTIVTWVESFTDNVARIWIEGFTSDPGQDFFEYAGIIGGAYLPSAAATYTYISGFGVATWEWNTSVVGGWGFTPSSPVDVELTF